MKKIVINLAILSLVVFSGVKPKVLEDKIMARVSLLGNANILLSDLNTPHLDADSYTLEEAITKELYFQEAIKRKLNATVTDVESQITAFKKGNGLGSEEELEEYLNNLGFTLKKYKAEIARYIAINSLLQIELKARVFVTAQEVESYYNAHPIWEEEKYILKTCIIPFDEVKSEDDVAKIATDKLDWIKTDDWVGKSFLSEQMAFVSDLKVGEVSKPIKTDHGYQLVIVEDKKEKQKVSLENSYIAIEKKLKEEKMKKFEAEYKKELWDKATIVYLN